jgi:rhomboid protease GluP
MPSKEQQFSYPGRSAEELLQIAYGTFLSLGWTPKYVVDDAIIGYTPRSWKKYDDEIVVTVTESGINIKSSLVHGEMFDATGKNAKHIAEYSTAFEKLCSRPLQSEWEQAIEQLKHITVKTAEEQIKEAEETDKVMKQAGANLYTTYGIIAINVLVFILMAINGAGIFTIDDTSVHINWGSNLTTLTLNGEWWRLLTCTFIHFGILHLAMNTYALYMAGVYLEPMLGKTKYITAYLCTGILSSVLSLWWHTDGVNSAGASGAIFGLYGVFLALLLTNLIPKQVRKGLLQSIGVFIVYNLAFGMKSGVDNAGHIGGLLSGLAIGFIYYLILSKKIKLSGTVIALLISVITVLGAGFFLKNYKSDFVRVDQLYREFFDLQDKATQANTAGENSATSAEYKKILSEMILPVWKRNLSNLNEMGNLNMSSTMKGEQEKLKNYTVLKIEETELLIIAQDTPSESNTNAIDEVRKKINEVLKENKE